MRGTAIALVVFALACTTTTSVTRTGTGIFAPKGESAAEEDPPRGLTLEVASIAPDGTVMLDLRNYSNEPFVFSGTPEHPQLIFEVASGNTESRHTISPFGRTAHEVVAGDRIQLKAKIGGVIGRVRIGVRSREFGYMVWTDWIAP